MGVLGAVGRKLTDYRNGKGGCYDNVYNGAIRIQQRTDVGIFYAPWYWRDDIEQLHFMTTRNRQLGLRLLPNAVEVGLARKASCVLL